MFNLSLSLFRYGMLDNRVRVTRFMEHWGSTPSPARTGWSNGDLFTVLDFLVKGERGISEWNDKLREESGSRGGGKRGSRRTKAGVRGGKRELNTPCPPFSNSIHCKYQRVFLSNCHNILYEYTNRLMVHWMRKLKF